MSAFDERDYDWDWPEWHDADEWDDVAVARVWETVLKDYLQLGVQRRALQLYSDVLKDFYMAPLVAQLNATTPLIGSLLLEEYGAPYVHVPPPWHICKWRRLKYKLRYKRQAFGRWVGGIEDDDDWDD